MERRGPWTRHSTETLLERRFFSVMSDKITDPAGTDDLYDWVNAPDQVRVAALHDDNVYVVQQHHYLPTPGNMRQLPGGNLDIGEDPAAAAARELAEEVGATAGAWSKLGAVYPLPGLTNARVHLYLAEDLLLGEANPKESEADLVATPVQLAEAVDAALSGRIGCAASAQLVLTVAARRQPRGTTPGRFS